jgi:ribonuclease HII
VSTEATARRTTEATEATPLGVHPPTLRTERRLWRAGHEWVAGLDEVGRGAWAGPLTVGVAVVRPNKRSQPRWLRDSKMLAEERRESLFDEVAGWCAAWAVGHADAAECDRWGMTAALRLAGYRALAGLDRIPDALLIDGPIDVLAERPLPESRLQPPLSAGAGTERIWGVDGPDLPPVRLPDVVLPKVDADAHCSAVAAASVLAKVVRDRLMRDEAEHYPPYHFERNKGYPSPLHKIALRGYGLSAIHRRTWAFVEDLPWR